MPYSRRQFLFSSMAAAAAPVQPPNIVLILMDDLGWPSTGSYGNKLVPTPHLDRLAAEGMQFSQAYVTPQCTPTRATLLSGQYTARNRMWHVIGPYGMHWARVREPRYSIEFPRDAFTIGKGLQAAGYKTACIGKWHVTNNEDGNYSGLKQEAAQYYGFDVTSKPMVRPNEIQTGDKAVDRLTNEAIAFIEANRRRPFFCYLSHHTIHGPVVAPPDIVKKYRDKGFPAEGLNNAAYLAAIEHFDTAIGRLLGRLDSLGLRDNTLVMFLSDNGGVSEMFLPNPPVPPDGSPVRLLPGRKEFPNTPLRGLGNSLRPGSSRKEFPNTPLRGLKGSAYEGGIRVPMIVRWPGVTRPGTTCETPVHAVDLMPTFLDMAGARAPQGYVQDGASIVPLLGGRQIAGRALYWYMPFYDLRWGATPCAVILDGGYKLIEYFGDYVDLTRGAEYVPKPALELYDLKNDIGETTNLAARQPEKARAMQKRLRQWILSTGAEIPGPNPRYDPKRAFEEARGFAPE